MIILERSDSNIYLTCSEIKMLAKKDFSSKPVVEIARDIFLIGCYTGFRVSEYNGLTTENIEIINGQKFVKVHKKKTDELICVPVPPDLNKIIVKYNNGFPSLLKLTTLAKGIQEACKEVGLENYEYISFVTARRSFKMNKYIANNQKK